MAVITQVEVANFLCEGYGTGGQAGADEWTPLYRGVTMHLRGLSTAIQLNNGDGKSSLSNAILYLLSRDSRLKEKVGTLCAPVEKGWTHIRIEFGEKSPGEDISQGDFVTRTAEEFPGITYVIGMCWNRDGKDPHFYRYQGDLRETPVYEKSDNGLRLIDNDTFKKSIEALCNASGKPRAMWNKWGRTADWLDEIKSFVDIAMVQQNVAFQLKGGGDASVMLKEIKTEGSESYDAAFFRVAIAPELLKDPMGAEGGGEEAHYEDTLLKSLLAAAHSTTNIAKSQLQLDQAELALTKFGPVLERAEAVITANATYKDEFELIVSDAAIIHILAERNTVPGIPQFQSDAIWRKNKKLVKALSHMVIDKREGVLITDEGLSALVGIPTKKINEKGAPAFSRTIGTQVIDFKGDLKFEDKNAAEVPTHGSDTQVLDYKGDLKISGNAWGGRRHALTGYDLEGARALLPSVANLAGADINGLEDILLQAFEIATGDIDTNAYRQLRNRLLHESHGIKKEQHAAEQAGIDAQEQIEALISETREVGENQIAYEDFAKRKAEFPQEFWELPVDAKKWAQNQFYVAQEQLHTHGTLSGKLENAFALWEKLSNANTETDIVTALSNLEREHGILTAGIETAKNTLETAKGSFRQKDADLRLQLDAVAAAKKQYDQLDQFRTSLPLYEQLFGDADPATLDPRRDLNRVTHERQSKVLEHSNAKHIQDSLATLQPQAVLFHKLFGDVDPKGLNPTRDERDHREKLEVEERILADHRPGIESLDLFRERYPNQVPEQWLAAISAERVRLYAESTAITAEIRAWRTELADLDKYALADNRVYAGALAALDKKGIAYERLHSVIMRSAVGDRRKTILTLFSGALSAPVVNLADAESATEILELNRVTVPVFLNEPTLQFISSGDVINAGELSHTFLVGRYTRQVEILLNPDLIKEEKKQIETKLEIHVTREIEIVTRLSEIAEGTSDVVQTVQANTAISRNSEAKSAEAQGRLDKLFADLPAYMEKASPTALSAIHDMDIFLKKGGLQTLTLLTEKTIPQLDMLIKRLDAQLLVLENQSSDEALRAIENIKKFVAAGGEETYSRLAQQIYLLEPEVEALRQVVDDLRNMIANELEGNLEAANRKLNLLLQTYTRDHDQLEAAIKFERDGHHTFMFEAPAEARKLTNAITDAQSRLQGIDYVRAALFIVSKNSNSNIAERMAAAKAKKTEAVRTNEQTRLKLSDLNGQIALLTPLVDALHDMAFELIEKSGKLRVFNEEIRVRMRNAMGTHPEMQKDAEDIRLACLAQLPGTGHAIEAAIANLRESVKNLNVDTKHLLALNEAKRIAQNSFRERRAEFCDKTRSGEIKGLNELEVKKIEAANSIEELTEIQSLRITILQTIDEEKTKVTAAKELAEASKDASINNMTRFALSASRNLDLLHRVMRKTPKARFFIEAQVADETHIRRVVESLLSHIEDMERVAGERATQLTNKDISRRERGYRDFVKETIYREIFVNPKVEFSHAGIWKGERRPFNEILSMGQKTALHLMWLIKQAEFSLLRAVYQFGTKKQRDAALRNSQHILFFDGLFSNLSNERIINEAFEGLKYVGDAFQLIGLIHNTRYVNNKDIFPVHLIGRRFERSDAAKNDGRGFVTVEPWQQAGDMAMFSSAYKPNIEAAALELPEDDHFETAKDDEP